MGLDFQKCPECDQEVIYCSTTNVRNGKWQVIPLQEAPDGVRGNFRIDEDNMQMAKNLAMEDVGPYPVALYGQGIFVPHNPSHFTGAPHMDEDWNEEALPGSEHVEFTTEQGIPRGA